MHSQGHPPENAQGDEEQISAVYSQEHPPQHSKSKCRKHQRENKISQGTNKKAVSSNNGDVSTEEETVHSGHGYTELEDALGLRKQVSAMHSQRHPPEHAQGVE